MSEILVKRTRGDVVEAIHRGHIVVINEKKEILHSVGDPYYYTYLRSSAKPIQALQIILSGTADHYKFSDQELSLMCASHYGEEAHIETVKSIMEKAGIAEKEFLCGSATSLSYDYAIKLARMGIEDNPLISDCSGKHSGMIAICNHMNYDKQHYLNPDHQLQIENLKLISQLSEYSSDQIKIGIDGCSVPVYAMPIYNMAIAFLNLVNHDHYSDQLQTACRRIFKSMTSYPFMVSGTNGFCTALMSATKGRLIGKIGAEGVYCIGFKIEKIALAVKIEDGCLDILPNVVMEILKQLDLLSKEEYETLKNFHISDNLNDNNYVVGKIYPEFKFK